MKKRKSLQPWLDYFEMLCAYEKHGFLEMKPDKHEAYITRAALFTLSAKGERVVASNDILVVASRLRAYASYLSASCADYNKYAFAIHVVKEDEPHDLLCTLLLTRSSVWWRLLGKTDKVDVINYEYK